MQHHNYHLLAVVAVVVTMLTALLLLLLRNRRSTKEQKEKGVEVEQRIGITADTLRQIFNTAQHGRQRCRPAKSMRRFNGFRLKFGAG